ncbi:MAG: hypothetical protein WBM86_27715, partial [Waterburya sp.]
MPPTERIHRHFSLNCTMRPTAQSRNTLISLTRSVLDITSPATKLATDLLKTHVRWAVLHHYYYLITYAI